MFSNAIHRMMCHRFLYPTGKGNLIIGEEVGSDKEKKNTALSQFSVLQLVSLQRECKQSVQWLEATESIAKGDHSFHPYDEEEVTLEVNRNLEQIQICFGNCCEKVNGVETALMVAVAVHSVFVLPPPYQNSDMKKNPNYKTHGLQLAHQLCQPDLSFLRGTHSGNRHAAAPAYTAIPFVTVPLTRDQWCLAAVPAFLALYRKDNDNHQNDSNDSNVINSSLIVHKEGMVRLTCVAERPLDTAACNQHMSVWEDNQEGTLSIAFSLSKEVK